MYHGDIRLGQTIDCKFTSRAFATGAPSTLSSSPVISAYVGNSATQITAGITLSVDFDSVTGLNNVRVVASGGNGFATGTDIALVITTGTVGGVSVVGETVATFSIENRSALMPATAGRTLVVDAAGLADANTVKVGPTGSGTAQTAGDIMADTNDIQTRLPAALVSGRMDCSVGAMAANVLTATAINADAITAAKIADAAIDAATFAAGAINAAAIASDAITAAKIADGAIDAATFAAGAINAAAIAADAITDAKVASDVTIASVTGNVGGNVTGSVGSVASGGITAASFAADSITAAKLAADVTTELQAGLATAANLATVAGYVDTEVAAIKAKTDQLTFSTTNRVDAQVFGMEASTVTAAAIATDAIDADAIKADAVTEIQSGLASATNLATVAGYIDTEVAAIKAKTDNLPASPAATGDIPSAAAIADAVWDEAISGHAASGSTGEALSDAGGAGTPPTVGEIADAVWDEAIAGHAGAGSTGEALSDAGGAGTPLDAAGVRAAIGLASANLDTQLDALPTNAELATALGTADDAVLAQVALVKAKTDNLPSDPADQSLVIAATDAIYARLGAPAGASVSADIALKTGYRLSSAGVDDIVRTALVESYAADGAAPTLSQLLFMAWSMLNSKAIIGTTLTTRKVDHATAAMTFTLDDGAAPTSQVRAT